MLSDKLQDEQKKKTIVNGFRVFIGLVNTTNYISYDIEASVRLEK